MKTLASKTVKGDWASCEVVAFKVRDEFIVSATLTWDGGETVQERTCYTDADAMACFVVACGWAESQIK